MTYLFEGEITHRDSTGVTQDIRPGEVNWMVAGSGIVHSERFEHMRPTGGNLHAIQAWVGLPTEDEETAPSFHHHGAADLPTYESGGLWARLIAGYARDIRDEVDLCVDAVVFVCEGNGWRQGQSRDRCGQQQSGALRCGHD